MQKKYFLVIILVIGAALRFYDVEKEDIWLDESISIRFSDRSFMGTIAEDSKDNTPPTFDLFLNFWIRMFGKTALAVRSLSVVIGIISIYLIYIFSKELFGENVALISGLLLSISPFAINYSQEARSYSLLMLVSTCSMYFYVKILKESRNITALLHIFFTLLGLYTHVFGIFIPIIQNIHFFLSTHRKKKHSSKKWLLSQAIILLLYLPWIVIMADRFETFRDSTGKWIDRATFFGPGQQALFYTFYDFSGNSILAAIFFLSTFIYVVKYKSKDNLLLVWLFLPILTVFVFSKFFTPVYVTRYFISSLVPFLIICAKAILEIQGNTFRIIILLVVVLSSLYVNAVQYYEINKNEWSSAASHIMDERSLTEPMVVGPMYAVNPLLYYYNYDCLISDEGPYNCAEKINIYPLNMTEPILNKIIQAESFWVVITEPSFDENVQIFLHEINASSRQISKKHFLKGITLYHFNSS